MYLSKFLVIILLLLQFSINTISGQSNNAITDNRINDKTIYDINDVDNGTDMSFVKLIPLESTSMTDNRTSERRHGKQSAADDDDFEFLITGGYRPQTNLLVQFAVSLRRKREIMFFGDDHYCGGAIISLKAILTAAHCIVNIKTGNTKKKARDIKVVAGTERRLVQTDKTQILAVEKVIPHSKYNSAKISNDIGILKLKDEIKLNNGFVAIIPIADTAPKPGTKCTIVGWGSIIESGPAPDAALNADVIIRDESDCTAVVPPLPKGTICANNQNDHEIDSCQGDSGGPMFCNNQLAGIVSYGSGCGRPGQRGVYSDVYYHRKWIAENAASSMRQSNALIAIDTLMLLHLTIIKMAINTVYVVITS
ncbi:trypsin-3 [Drosophila tropicalis]|uniref:trypsin-3 n=1 Tax=Drosophila tropicalis TaxID=46794 RepID=UPI0035ABE852